MGTGYTSIFGELIRTPFQEIDLIWGIVPLYFGLLLNEMTSTKANFRTAIQTGFSFLWAGAQWTYPYFHPDSHDPRHPANASMAPINLFVTTLVILFGILALISGIRRRFPKYCSFLGYTRFSNYLMITIYPMQAHRLPWTWDRLVTIGLFALPIWLVLHLGLMPIRRR